MPSFSIGDRVKVLSDKEKVKALQNGHGEWIKVMEATLGQVGKVKAILPSGDLRVKVCGNTFTFNSKAVKEVDGDSSDSSDSELKVGDLNKMLQAFALLGALEAASSRGGVNPQVAELFNACLQGNTSKVRSILQSSSINVNQRIRDTTLLNVAANKGHPEIVKMLLEKGADLSIADDDGDTALHCALLGGKVEILRLLVGRQGCPHNVRNNKGLTALHLAVLAGRKSEAQLLLQNGSSPNTQDNAGDTPAHDAIDKKYTDMLRLLLDKGGSCTTTNKRGFTILHWASLKDNNEAVRIILEKNKSAIDARKEDGFTALHLAAFNDNVQVIETLQSLGNANPNIKNNAGQTPLHLAATKTHMDAVRQLVEGSTRPKIDLNAKDSDGDTALHEANRRVQSCSLGGGLGGLLLGAILQGQMGNPESAKQIATYLVEQGADVQVRNNKNETTFDVCEDSDFKLQLSLAISSRGGGSGGNAGKNAANARLAIQGENSCGNCGNASRDTVFQCGHMFCNNCGNKVNVCPTCKTKVKQRIKVFN